MSSVVVDLENALQAMQAGKPPGVSGSKIAFITELSVNNVQSESVIIQKLYTHFKKCPGTHKLGPLYVVDSIARRYLDYARKNHEEVFASAPDGTYAAGVYRITNLLPSLMNDILQHAPAEENKDKIEKLYAIWERSATFPHEVLQDIKAKMHSSPMWQPQNPNESHTPPGSPPLHIQSQYGASVYKAPPQQSAPPEQPATTPPSNGSTDVASMLAAIAQMAKQNQPAAPSAPVAPAASVPPALTPAPAPAPAAAPPYTTPTTQAYPLSATPLASTQAGSTMPPHSVAPTLPYTSTPPTNGNPLAALAGLANPYGMFQQPGQSVPAFPGFPVPQQQPQQTPQQTPIPQADQMQQLALLQLLLSQAGLQQNTGATGLAPALQALLGAQMAQQQPQQQMPQQDASAFWAQMQQGANQNPAQPSYNQQQQNNEPQGGRGYSPPPRSPPRYSGRPRGRTRSKSPDRFDGAGSPGSFRRRSPVYGEYEGNDSGRMNDGGRGGQGRGRNGRVRSPMRRRDRTPPGKGGMSAKGTPDGGGSQSRNENAGLPKVPKNITFDTDLGPNQVRVLSRTLFVGGVTIGEQDLRHLFEGYGIVQSCIVNQDKRHAFIKMLTREDAVRAKNGMETYRTDSMTLRTRWGVGFGPRDCSDYQTGVSVIPIERLTEADQRWMVSAEYGGTGGQPLAGGMCVEEPDIEIGQGVSSKAISKRFPTDSGGAKGPRSTNDRGHHGKRKGETSNANAIPVGGRDNNTALGVAPPTPGFGFPFTMPGLPPNMPPGFQYPGYPGAGAPGTGS